MSADDAQGGSSDPSVAGSGMFGVVGAVAAGATAAAAKAMRVEGETLSKFKRRVDALLRDLEKSHAAPSKIATGTLGAGQLGTFDEADSLHSSYTHVHTQLENLSKMLALQIEALVVTVDASKTGYDNLDEDVRARLSRIRSGADALTGGPHTKSPSHQSGSKGGEGGEPSPKPTDGEAGGL
ncbi:DUF2563 family protein [Streptomyces sp. NBC_01446]|uniref:DUF2563 family protein n=1 Tax=Streptomyces sp. NBC_01446 TaxID=2903870 RepID=UPI00224DFF54|nr:DUF2563 family protein [Streptomyces sp. NBC_01446]MCX4641780.1 DUF2563 family protein [Streptomyces sp. NBC_01446]